MTRPSNTQPSSHELLERGRLTLQAIQYHERAARFQAAAASLQAAMVQAENGNTKELHEWLESDSHQFKSDMDLVSQADFERRTLDTEMPIRSIRIDQPNSATQIVDSVEPSYIDPPSEKAPIDETDHIKVVAQPVDPPIGNSEPRWAKMEQAANERLGAVRSDVAIKTKTPSAKSPIVAAPVDSPEANELYKALKVGNDLAESIELPDELRISLDNIEFEHDSHNSGRWWKAPHVWVSVFVHVVLIICLSIIAITVAKEPKLLSIVSASVEAENVILETPMEAISELETTSEPLQSTSLPNLSDLVAEDLLAAVPIETGSSPSPPPSVSSAIATSASDSVNATMTGSKMLVGAEFFGVKATGNTFVYIVDSSPSMRRDGAFEAAQKEIVRSLSSMKPKQRYFVSFFGKEIDPMVLELGVAERYPIYAKPENVTKTIDWLNRVQVQKEGLPPNNALAEAIGMQPDAIFLLFDGDTKVDVAKFLRRINRTDDILSAGMPKVPIHVVHFFQDEFQKQMRLVAAENGGTYRFVPRPERTSKKSR